MRRHRHVTAPAAAGLVLLLGLGVAGCGDSAAPTPQNSGSPGPGPAATAEQLAEDSAKAGCVPTLATPQEPGQKPDPAQAAGKMAPVAPAALRLCWYENGTLAGGEQLADQAEEFTNLLTATAPRPGAGCGTPATGLGPRALSGEVALLQVASGTAAETSSWLLVPGECVTVHPVTIDGRGQVTPAGAAAVAGDLLVAELSHYHPGAHDHGAEPAGPGTSGA